MEQFISALGWIGLLSYIIYVTFQLGKSSEKERAAREERERKYRLDFAQSVRHEATEMLEIRDFEGLVEEFLESEFASEWYIESSEVTRRCKDLVEKGDLTPGPKLAARMIVEDFLTKKRMVIGSTKVTHLPLTELSGQHQTIKSKYEEAMREKRQREQNQLGKQLGERTDQHR
jgi:hypothetical protein